MRILLIIYDNDSFISFFPVGLAYIASVLRNEGIEVEIYQQDMHHYPEEHLTRYLDQNRFDAVGIGVIAGYYQYAKLLKISHAINKSTNRPPHYILGGHGPTPEPAYFLKKTGADFVVLGEGEETIIELLKALDNGTPLSAVRGIAYRQGDKVTLNPRRELIQDIDSIPWPAYDLFPIEYYRLMRYPHTENRDFSMPVLSARGCIFKCNFCYRMDEGYRARDPLALVEEIRYLQKEYDITYIEFADELLMSSEARAEELCNAFIKSGLSFKWYCNGRLNFAKPAVLRLMKEAGCVFINYGIESLDDAVLRRMGKALTEKQIIRGIEATLAAGISPGFNIIFGHIGDSPETLQKGVDFLLNYDDGAQLRTIRPVTPYPGSALYYYSLEKGLLNDVADFYEHKHINSDLLAVNFTDIEDNEFHRLLMEANTTLIGNYFKNRTAVLAEVTRNLYINWDEKFRGYRQT
jgi:anaerobic magnesium-protoporphyrin IX monomethyl ester cyclase